MIQQISIGAAIEVTGVLEESQGKGQAVEIQVTDVKINALAHPDDVKKTILSPKKHSFEKLREQAHLRVRTNTMSAVMRLRSKLSFAVHQYFNENDFYHMHTPIITQSDAEGAGESFKVTNFDLDQVPQKDGKVDFEQDFFGKPTNLTVSGQLEAETYAMGLSNVYTFGPTFRAENSNTSRHLAEFWMIEPEMAFCDLDRNMDIAQEFIQYVTRYVYENCKEDLQFLDDRLQKEEAALPKQQRSEMSLLEKSVL